MQNIYFTYRQHYTNTGVKYDVSYYNDKQYADYKEAGLTEMQDGNSFIPENRIVSELIPGVKSLRKAGVLKYDDTVVDGVQLSLNLQNVAQGFGVEIKTPAEMSQWIRDNTDLTEITTDIFELFPERTDDVTGELVPAEYLIIS